MANSTIPGAFANSHIQAPTNATNREQNFHSFVAYNRADNPAGAPPDVSIAVSKTQVMHVNNFSVRVFNRTGSTRPVNVTAATFFSQDSGFTVSDPQVVYDAATNRWFASAMEFNSGATGGKVLLLVSHSGTLSNSTTWKRYVVDDEVSTLLDQPKLGLTTDKVLISYERFTGGTTFAGPEVLVANKGEAVAFRSTLHEQSTAGGSNDFGMAPANNDSAATTGWAMETGFDGATLLTLVRIDGVPSATSNVFFSVTTRSLATPTASPPNADSGGSAGRIRAGDTRIADAVWRKGTLTFVSGQACLPFGSGSSDPPVDCIRLWRVATPSLDVVEDSLFGFSHNFLYDPAVTYSLNGDLHMVFNFSALSSFAPSIAIVGRPAGSGSWGNSQFLTLEDVVDYTGLEGSPPYRWGDFNSAVPDPLNPTDAFVAAESTDPVNTSAPNFQIVVGHIGIALDKLSIATSAATITKGHSVKITGKLTRPSGEAQKNETVQLWRKLAGASSFTLFKTRTTSSSGVVTYTDTPTKSAQYKWVYPGAQRDNGVDRGIESTLGTQSAVKAVTVKA